VLKAAAGEDCSVEVEIAEAAGLVSVFELYWVARTEVSATGVLSEITVVKGVVATVLDCTTVEDSTVLALPLVMADDRLLVATTTGLDVV